MGKTRDTGHLQNIIKYDNNDNIGIGVTPTVKLDVSGSGKFSGDITVGDIPNATTDTDKFLVSDGGLVKYRTGAEMLSDLGVAPGVASNIQHQVKAGVAINKGQAVYVTSADGTNMIVGLASNASEATSSKTLGLLASTVSINGFANVIAEGLLSGLNTIGATAGDPVWLGTGGNLIYGLLNKPYAPAHLVFIGIVTRVNSNNGEIFVKVQNGFELKEIHDVDLITTTPINGHLLGFNGTLWVNKTVASWLGYTPVTDTRTVSTTSPLQGGGDLSVNRTLSITQSGISSDGYLSSTDWNTFNGKQNALGFTPYNSTNPAGYISGITSGNVTTALGFTPENSANRGTANGYASLDGSGLVPSTQLPSYVDDVLEYANLAGFPATGATGKIYVAIDTNKTYRWSGSAYIYITSGAVDSVAGRTGVVSLTSSDVGLSNVENKSSATIRSEISSSNVTTALGFTPYNATNPNGYISGITSGNVTTALGYTPYNATNPAGYISSITSGNVTTALGYTPANASGTTNYVSKFTGTTTLGNSQLYDNGTNVGIGTASPSTILEIKSADPNFTINQTTNTNNSGIKFQTGGNPIGSITAQGSNGNMNINMGPSAAWGGYITFQTDTSERMRITSAGNVGIGTTSPSRLLNISGAGTDGTQLQINGTTDSAGIKLIPTSGDNWEIQANTSNQFFVYNRTDSAYRFLIDGSGNVGIGTTSPTGQLEVYTNSYKQFNVSYPSIYQTRLSFGTAAYTSYDAGSATLSLFATDASYGSIALGAGGSEKMRIIANGNVGIGTTSPSYKTTIYGNSTDSDVLCVSNNQINADSSQHFVGISLQDQYSNGSGNVSAIRSYSNLYAQWGSTLTFSTTGTAGNGIYERMRITNTGNVGIGTSSPGAKLVVYSGASVTDYASFATGDGSNTIQYIPYVGTGDYNNLSYGGGSLLFNNIGSRLTVGTHNGTAIQFGPTNTLISGNVGIGTTNPQRRLDVVGDHNTSTFRVYYPELNVAGQDASVDIWASEPGISFNGSGIGSNVNGQPYYGRTNPVLGQAFLRFINGNMMFHTSTTDAVYAERMRIDSSGNVGIGTSSPGHKLQVSGTAGTSWSTLLQSNSKSAVYSAHADGYGMAIETSQNTSAIYTFKVAGGDGTNIGTNEYFRITGTGSVGIGTSSPSQRLDVNGNLSIGDGANADQNISIRYGSSSGAYGAVRFTQSGTNNSTIHAFSTAWQGGTIYNSSTGAININGSTGVTFGAWDNIDVAFNTGGTSYFKNNVGIGTTSPTKRLDVVSSTNDSFDAIVVRPLNQTQTLNIGWQGIATSLNFIVSTNGTEKMRVDTAGNVGIGTSSPSAKLDVNGDALINGLTIGRGGGNSAFNTALGVGALSSNTSGEYNVAIGRSANTSNNISGTTVIGADLFTNPSGVSGLTSNSIAISQYNPDNAGTQYPHFYAPDKISCPNNGAITDILSIDYGIYTAAFIEYSLFSSDGGQFRAGTYTIAFKSTGVPVDKDEQTVVYSNTTLGATFTYSQNGSVHTIQIENNGNDTYNIRITARLLMR